MNPDPKADFKPKPANAQASKLRARSKDSNSINIRIPARHLASLAICVVAAWLAVHVFTGSDGWMAYQRKKQENQKLQDQQQKYERENQELEGRINGLKNDPGAIEREAREQLGYTRPGETVYILPQKKPDVPAAVVVPPANASAEKK